jgi:hypothetical protein
LWGVPTPIPTPFGGRLASFTPTTGYPSVDLYQNGCIARAVHNGVHSFDHRLLQPRLCVRRLFCVALNNYLVVANKDWHNPRTLVPAFPQEGQRQLQAVGSGSFESGAGLRGCPANDVPYAKFATQGHLLYKLGPRLLST